MYHCHEIPFKAFESFDALRAAVERYPFKGGLCHQLDESRLNWKPAARVIEMYLTADTCPAADATFDTFQFTERTKVEVGSFPNDAANYITIWR